MALKAAYLSSWKKQNACNQVHAMEYKIMRNADQ